MGRHSAGNGAGIDPIVAAALRQRTTSVDPAPPRPAPGGVLDSPPVDRQQADSQPDGGLGWPGEPGEGSGLGWPDRDGTTHSVSAETTTAETATADVGRADTSVPDTSAPDTTPAPADVQPADATRIPAVAAAALAVAAVAVAASPVPPATGDDRPARRRSGWRRWFGRSPAASPAGSGRTAV